jgi:hypothetical protein
LNTRHKRYVAKVELAKLLSTSRSLQRRLEHICNTIETQPALLESLDNKRQVKFAVEMLSVHTAITKCLHSDIMVPVLQLKEGETC